MGGFSFLKTPKAEITVIVGGTFKLALLILRRGESLAEKNPECSGARLSLWREASFFS